MELPPSIHQATRLAMMTGMQSGGHLIDDHARADFVLPDVDGRTRVTPHLLLEK